MKINQFLKINAVAIAAIMFTGALMSFKIVEKKAAETQYYYNSSDVTEGSFSDVNKWAIGTSPSCLTSGDRPCKMIVPEGDSLEDQIGGLTNAQVLAIHAGERRP
ncbi:hypothetical protein [Chryseobacterium sp. CCH4-E10]|uniref:hypothetical protein n=1 Tax=Chryseobacterium sp. CCH4-E10 TaxID=1768758 RepID=UPI00083056CC|nr:hypothetical protein [Chryseobacterium sp. CCH4-E10]